MRAGRLRHRLTVLAATTTGDGRGGRTKTWATLSVVQGEIVPIRGDEQATADRLVAEVLHHFSLRYSRTLAAVTPQDTRLWWQGRLFEVVSVRQVDGQHRELEGEAKEIAA